MPMIQKWQAFSSLGQSPCLEIPSLAKIPSKASNESNLSAQSVFGIIHGKCKCDVAREVIICSWSWYCTAKSQPRCRQSKPLAPDQAIPYHIMKRTRRTPRKDAPPAQPLDIGSQSSDHGEAYLVDDEYLVTAFVPSETACLANSPGRISRTL